MCGHSVFFSLRPPHSEDGGVVGVSPLAALAALWLRCSSRKRTRSAQVGGDRLAAERTVLLLLSRHRRRHLPLCCAGPRFTSVCSNRPFSRTKAQRSNFVPDASSGRCPELCRRLRQISTHPAPVLKDDMTSQ
ncbi:hypothetical protein JOB18_028521 [Solea senegalensis]|uniref:Uncharacterized protein n=1 Tax=Solea senegalensis TaxID=28829 RepID=A0AAV6Q777_SOLSE|nr:hypothetical protein JOB18_028521 [Solea senegalensis]